MLYSVSAQGQQNMRLGIRKGASGLAVSWLLDLVMAPV